MAVVLIAGGTGLVGRALSAMLSEKGYEVIILSRSKAADSPYTFATWDPAAGIIDVKALQRADYIVNLSGAGVAEKRWSRKRKQQIRSSRVDSSRLIAASLAKYPNKVQAVIQASAMGWYGDDSRLNGCPSFTENVPPADSFFGETCAAWEESIQPVTGLGKRLVILRTGLVLDREGGALKEFARPVKFGIAAIMGNGNQVQSWIHISDLCRMFIFAIEDPRTEGVYNAVSPKPVSNKVLITRLATSLKGSFYIPLNVPSSVLKILLGEMGGELLKSLTISCDKIREAGFRFVYPSIESAMNELAGTKRS